MIRLKSTNFTARILPLLFPLLIILIRLYIGFNRYFDNDEFSHLHWAYLIASGLVPYRDFFFYITPYFQWFLTPLFLLPPGEYILILARILQVGIFSTVLFLIYKTTIRLTGYADAAWWAVIIFSVFPMTFDKTIDVRPDLLMILIYLINIKILIDPKSMTRAMSLLSGALISFNILLLPKILFSLPALIYLIFFKRKALKPANLILLAIGSLIPGLILLFYLAIHNQVHQAFLSVTYDAIAVNSGKSTFSPIKALSPWPLVYIDRGGPSFPWYANIAIWILALVGLIFYYLKKPRLGVFFITYFAFGIIFLFVFPAPYIQYFLPLSVMGSVLAGIAVSKSINLLKIRVLKYSVAAILIVCLSISFWIQAKLRLSKNASNAEQMSVIRDVLKMSRSDDRFYDMVGSYVFRPDGYYICCHPYAEFVDKLSMKVPSLMESVIKSGNKFLVLDRTGMSLWQPMKDDLAFLKSNYLPAGTNWKIYVPGVRYNCLAGICTRLDNESVLIPGYPDNSFRVVFEGDYIIKTSPAGLGAEINGQRVNGPIRLQPGTYTLTVDPDVRILEVRWRE